MNREHPSPGSQFCSFIWLPEKSALSRTVAEWRQPQAPFPAHVLDPVQVPPALSFLAS